MDDRVEGDHFSTKLHPVEKFFVRAGLLVSLVGMIGIIIGTAIRPILRAIGL